MFRTANKVTRPEKALILGFMAGSRFVFTFVSFENSMIIPFLFRDNPCPHLGNIVTIKLSENQENVPQTDNTYLTMIVETHFQVISNMYFLLWLVCSYIYGITFHPANLFLILQMNYNTGEWKRIKKYRRLEDVLQQQQQQQ